jgi:glycerophosphoryl diester phosphodiesterase
MSYEKQAWTPYDPTISEDENIINGGVGTAERMNHIEDGISNIDSNLASHIADKSNPHGVNASNVGLGNVKNYGIATNAEAIAGTATNKYMTPFLVSEAVKSIKDSVNKAQLNKVTANDGQANIVVSGTDTLINSFIVRGAGFYTFVAGSATDAPELPLRGYVDMSRPGIGNVYAASDTGKMYHRFIENSKWKGDWQELVNTAQAQLKKVTADDGTAALNVADSETMLDRILGAGAGLKTGLASAKVVDSPSTTSATRFSSIMIAKTGGSVIAQSADGRFWSRIISGSKWHTPWAEMVPRTEFDALKSEFKESVATKAEAEAGEIDNKFMSPLQTKNFYQKATEKVRQKWRDGLNWIAHRGNNTDYPENSIPAFKNSNRHWGIETDIQVTSDGRWVVMHDDTVDRTTNGTGTVKSMTLAQFRALRIDTGANLATLSDVEKTPPTLDEFLSICREKNKIPVIEIKPGTYTTQNYTDLQTILSNYGYSDTNCVIISFSFDVLQQVRKLYKDMELHFLSGTVDDTIISNTLTLGFPVALSASYGALSADIVNRLHSLGVKVSCYTVPDNQFEKMKQMNVDYITTNSLSGNLRFQRLELLNGFTHATDAGRVDNGYVEEMEGGQIHINFNLINGVNDQNKSIGKLPDWAVPMYRQYCYCSIRTSSGMVMGTFDVNGRLAPNTGEPRTFSVGLNWGSRSTWVAGSTIYKL